MASRHFSFSLQNGETFSGILLVDDSQRLIINVGAKRFHMLWSDRWGPSVADKHGDPADKQPGPRHAFWRAASLWNRQGQRRDGIEAIWHEPAPEILQEVGRYRRGREIRVIQHGEDPIYSRTILLPAENSAPLAASQKRASAPFPPDEI